MEFSSQDMDITAGEEVWLASPCSLLRIEYVETARLSSFIFW